MPLTGISSDVPIPGELLTRLCDTMLAALTAQPEYSSDMRCIVLIRDGHLGGYGIDGYADADQLVDDTIAHLRIFCETAGKELRVIPLGRDV